MKTRGVIFFTLNIKTLMQLEKATRKKVKLRLSLASPSGFGKTYGALLIAFGITNNWKKIAVIDSENESSSLYAHLGDFNTISLKPPYSPDRYIEAIRICENAGMELVIIDSVTHIWKGEGGLLEYQNALGGRYQDWAKATPLYQKWLSAVLNSPCHIITTTRKKQAYNLITEGNKTKVEKAGMEDEIRDGYEYEMSVALEIINDKHLTKASKDRTGLFTGNPEFVITKDTGKKILEWCNSGDEIQLQPLEEITLSMEQRITTCLNMKDLVALYNSQEKEVQEKYKYNFTSKRNELVLANTETPIVHLSKELSNGNIGTTTS